MRENKLRTVEKIFLAIIFIVATIAIIGIVSEYNSEVKPNLQLELTP